MIHDFASFLRWRLKPNRWALKGLNLLGDLPNALAGERLEAPQSALAEAMEREGFVKLERDIELPQIELRPYRGRAAGKPFVDIKSDHPALVESTLVELLGDPEVAALVLRYFGGRPWLWNFALNYSDPMDGVTDSQLWHFDYGDTRQLHFLVYFTDVGPESGPFTFLPAAYSDRVARHPFVIERMTDADLSRRFGIDAGTAATRLLGKRGEVFANDPGRLMHQGARCTLPRLVLFVTFTSRSPMSSGGGLTISHPDRAAFGEALARACPESLLPPTTFA